MTGARIMCTLLNDLETMRVGGGQGMAMLLEWLH
jgi:acetyl-CoA acetyltransferase